MLWPPCPPASLSPFHLHNHTMMLTILFMCLWALVCEFTDRNGITSLTYLLNTLKTPRPADVRIEGAEMTAMVSNKSWMSLKENLSFFNLSKWRASWSQALVDCRSLAKKDLSKFHQWGKVKTYLWAAISVSMVSGEIPKITQHGDDMEPRICQGATNIKRSEKLPRLLNFVLSLAASVKKIPNSFANFAYVWTHF